MGEGGAFDAGEEAVCGGRGSCGERVLEELEAGGAEGRRVETEDARGAEAAIVAAEVDVVEEPPVVEAAVAAAGGGCYR